MEICEGFMMEHNEYDVNVAFPPFCSDERRARAEQRAKSIVTEMLMEKLLPNRPFTVRLRQSWNFDAEKARAEGMPIPIYDRAFDCWIRYDIDIISVDEHPAATERLMDTMRRLHENRKYSLRQRIVRAWRVLRGMCY